MTTPKASEGFPTQGIPHSHPLATIPDIKRKIKGLHQVMLASVNESFQPKDCCDIPAEILSLTLHTAPVSLAQGIAIVRDLNRQYMADPLPHKQWAVLLYSTYPRHPARYVWKGGGAL